MKYLHASYPFFLLAFSVFLSYAGQMWYSAAVFAVSAFCWLANVVNIKNKVYGN